MYTPDRPTFLRTASPGCITPVYREILADLETPVSAFMKIAADARYAFLLESVAGGERVARHSFIGANPRIVLRCKGHNARWITADGQRSEHIAEGQDALHLLKRVLAERDYRASGNQPPFTGGAVGFFGYDTVRFFEKLPDRADDDLQVDDCCMMVADTIVIFDHVKRKARVECNVLVEGDPSEAYRRAQNDIETIIRRLRAPLPTTPDDSPTGGSSAPTFASNMSRDQYEAGVQRCREYISAGDCLQVVLSQRFTTQSPPPEFDIYRSLRSLNPSPYMFFLRMDDTSLIGASPEVLVTCIGGMATVRPIAGTRPRGDDEAADTALSDELIADEKERAEHLMLVDLGRNDIGRVVEYGSVRVPELMVIERYSHVMHIVSDVKGRLRQDIDAFDLFRACFPAGTVSGAPKVRSMEIIEELEPTRRGPYAGAVGYFGYGGDMDTCITIRTILIKDGRAHIQAGAGIVADSVPEREYAESLNKASAAMRAIEMANNGLD